MRLKETRKKKPYDAHKPSNSDSMNAWCNTPIYIGKMSCPHKMIELVIYKNIHGFVNEYGNFKLISSFEVIVQIWLALLIEKSQFNHEYYYFSHSFFTG